VIVGWLVAEGAERPLGLRPWRRGGEVLADVQIAAQPQLRLTDIAVRIRAACAPRSARKSDRQDDHGDECGEPWRERRPRASGPIQEALPFRR
jgi:hypothetical protein